MSATTAAARALGKNLHDNITPNKADAAVLANNVDRYKSEADAAKHWVESFEPAIKAHMEAQELFEKAQLLAEIGIVIASVALLIKKRIPWFGALALGALALGIVGTTLAGTSRTVHEAEEKIEETGKEYRDLRTAHKASELDDALVSDVRKWAGVSAPPPEHHGAEESRRAARGRLSGEAPRVIVTMGALEERGPPSWLLDQGQGQKVRIRGPSLPLP